MIRIQRALLSVTDKTGLEDLARGLIRHRVELVSTGGTAKRLREAGFAVREVSEYTGFPEILEGRVKTLHPRIHGGILARRSRPSDLEELRKHGIGTLDLVVVNLYRFEEAARNASFEHEDLLEEIDIGGPCLLRAAAKNHPFVCAVSDPVQYGRLLEEMDQNAGAVSESFSAQLAAEAFRRTASYDALVAGTLAQRSSAEEGSLPRAWFAPWERVSELRYGENPHQKAALYGRPGEPLFWAKPLHGKELSYNNLLDSDSAWRVASDLERHGAVIVKHNNPCGAGVGRSPAEAFRKALQGDSVSAYGGVLALNSPADPETTSAISEAEFLECVIAPEFHPEALEILKNKPRWGKNVRILQAGPAAEKPPGDLEVRSIHSGLLVQTRDHIHVDSGKLEFPLGRPSEAEMADLLFAWTLAKHTRSNAIVLAKDLEAVGIGAGQMSRVDATWLGIRKAGQRAKGAVMASDAFFPFSDSIEIAAAAGIRSVIHPGGSIRDAEVIEAARKAGMTMVVTRIRHFRH